VFFIFLSAYHQKISAFLSNTFSGAPEKLLGLTACSLNAKRPFGG
jgi:hypothetical protein